MSDDHDRLRRVGDAVDLALAIKCVELSRLAYAEPVEGESRAIAAGYLAYRHMQGRQGREFMIHVADHDLNIVAFRGTKKWSDWLTNLALWRVSTSAGRLHRGYYDAWRAMESRALQLIGTTAGAPTVFTGHSMGGALAVLAALAVQTHGVRVRSVVTFGQPQIGDIHFSRHVESNLNAPYYRFVHGADAIAAWGLGQDRRLGQVCYFDYRGRLQFGHRLTAMPKISFSRHRLQHYRYFLRLNRMKLEALSADAQKTIVPESETGQM